MKKLIRAVEERFLNYTPEQLKDKKRMSDTLRSMADNGDDIENIIFEIGIKAINKHFKKKYGCR